MPGHASRFRKPLSHGSSITACYVSQLWKKGTEVIKDRNQAFLSLLLIIACAGLAEPAALADSSTVDQASPEAPYRGTGQRGSWAQPAGV